MAFELLRDAVCRRTKIRAARPDRRTGHPRGRKIVRCGCLSDYDRLLLARNRDQRRRRKGRSQLRIEHCFLHAVLEIRECRLGLLALGVGVGKTAGTGIAVKLSNVRIMPAFASRPVVSGRASTVGIAVELPYF
jgi:hypothetical protein